MHLYTLSWPWLFFFLFTCGATRAQPIYNMSNQTVADCEGYLLDSDLGSSNNYDHNENYTFSICPPGDGLITLTFQSFCLEEVYDSLRVYDGPDTLSTLLGTFRGEEDPPTLVATSGCLTVNFVSDPNVACYGWVAFWETDFDIPDPPDILPIANLDCGSNSLRVTFAESIPCDSFYVDAFRIVGPQSPAVLSATPVDCNGGLATTVDLTFAPPLDFGGNFQVRFTRVVWACEIPYLVRSQENFAVINCPLNVALTAGGAAWCAGDSLHLFAEASGGDPNSYAFTWSPADTTGPALHTIAPDSAVIFVVTVLDANGATASDSLTIDPFPRPVLNLTDTVLCQSAGPLTLTADPPGGIWSGGGFAEGDEVSGIYDPDLVASAPDQISYEDENGCVTTLTVGIIPLDTGTADASCPGPGAPPFQVSGGLPAGGAWSGPFISPEGWFTPPDSPGSYEVTYTHPNGCSGSKEVNVGTIELPPLDTLCQSEAPFEIPVAPFGGLWSGPGITDADLGLLDPHAAGPGNHQLIYDSNGCSDTLALFIKEIDAGSDLVACPAQDPFVLPGNWSPPDGVWQGAGITDSLGLGGMYDPARVPGGYNDTLLFLANGCVDSRIVYVRPTRIRPNDTLRLCLEDDPVDLGGERIGAGPPGGVWSGPGVLHVNPEDNEWTFDPRAAATGSFTLYYEANTCVDSLPVRVFPNPVLTPAGFCIDDPVAMLEADLAGGEWSGPGMVDPEQGWFDPALAGEGRHVVLYESPAGCFGETEVLVSVFREASLEGLDPFYCYRDTSLLIGAPAGGVLTVDSVVVESFNPALAGAGAHVVRYTVGAGGCADSQAFPVTVGEPLQLILPFTVDSICFLQQATLTATASGGDPLANYSYRWDNGLGFGQTQYIRPTTTAIYTVTVSDGCSDPAEGSLTLHVHRPIYLDYTTGPTVCYDDTTFATVAAFPGAPQDYAYTWNSAPVQIGPTLTATPLTYQVEVRDDRTGCTLREDIELPGYPLIKARFGLAPNGQCLSILDPETQVLDFSVGGVTGYWDFGDGSPAVPYQFGAPLAHLYQDTGFYQVKLHIENEGGCVSEYETLACVLAEHRLYAPTAFSPNGDQINDEYQIFTEGIAELEWTVYDRYGGLLFKGSGPDDHWDGRARGTEVDAGVYLLVARYKTDYGYEGVVKGEIHLMR